MVPASRRNARRALALLMCSVAMCACGSAGAASSTSTSFSLSVLPSPTVGPTHAEPSPVKLTLASPLNDEFVSGTTVHVTVTVAGGTITSGYSQHVSPTVGHIHLYMNSQLVSMAYATSTDLPIEAGAEYSLYAEWVAEDHGSFTPRDVTPKIYFTVTG